MVLAGETDTLVRASEGVRGLYCFGAFADRVYCTPASVGPIGGDAATAVLDDYRSYGTITPNSGKVPALVSGRLTSTLPAGATILVAVNGRIGANPSCSPNAPVSQRPSSP